MAQRDVALEPRWRGARVMLAASAPVAAALAIARRDRACALARRGVAPTHAERPPKRRASADRRRRAYEHDRAGEAPPTPGRARRARRRLRARAASSARDVVQLREGELAVDARDREPITIVAGDTSVVIASSRAKVVARGGVIVTAHVFAGTAEVTEHGKRHVIDAGEVWTREPRRAAPTPAARAALDSVPHRLGGAARGTLCRRDRRVRSRDRSRWSPRTRRSGPRSRASGQATATTRRGSRRSSSSSRRRRGSRPRARALERVDSLDA